MVTLVALLFLLLRPCPLLFLKLELGGLLVTLVALLFLLLRPCPFLFLKLELGFLLLLLLLPLLFLLATLLLLLCLVLAFRIGAAIRAVHGQQHPPIPRGRKSGGNRKYQA